jgi:hypothetical protein
MLQHIRYSLDVIRDEACALIRQGAIHSKQPLYALCQYFPAGEWASIEAELESNDFLLRDQILDLIGCEEWCED